LDFVYMAVDDGSFHSLFPLKVCYLEQEQSWWSNFSLLGFHGNSSKGSWCNILGKSVKFTFHPLTPLSVVSAK
jgi:hypothetical protein